MTSHLDDDDLDELISCLEILETYFEHFDLNINSTEESKIEEMLFFTEEAVEICSFYYCSFETINNQQTVFAQIRDKLHELMVLFSGYRDIFNQKLDELNPTPSYKVHIERTGCIGRPRMMVNEDQVLGLRSLGMKWKKISCLLGISVKTLRRKRCKFEKGLTSYSELSETELDDLLRDVVFQNPNMGERMLQGVLLARGYKVQRLKLRNSIRRVNPNPQGFNKRRIFRRTYNVPCPNALW